MEEKHVTQRRENRDPAAEREPPASSPVNAEDPPGSRMGLRMLSFTHSRVSFSGRDLHASLWLSSSAVQPLLLLDVAALWRIPAS